VVAQAPSQSQHAASLRTGRDRGCFWRAFGVCGTNPARRNKRKKSPWVDGCVAAVASVRPLAPTPRTCEGRHGRWCNEMIFLANNWTTCRGGRVSSATLQPVLLRVTASANCNRISSQPDGLPSCAQDICISHAKRSNFMGAEQKEAHIRNHYLPSMQVFLVDGMDFAAVRMWPRRFVFLPKIAKVLCRDR
jgi:hypothetical protein